MVKKFYLLLVVLIPLTCLKAQLKIGDNPGILHSSAVLEAESTTKGILIPRMTTAQMNAIPTPALGLMVFNIDSSCLNFYFGGWKNQCSPANVGAWSLLGNTGTIAGTNFIGTTDAQDLVFKTNNTEGVRLNTSGNLGVGIISPNTGARLNVVGGDIILGSNVPTMSVFPDSSRKIQIRGDNGNNTDDVRLYNYYPSADITHFRVNIGDNGNLTSDLFQVGSLSFLDQKWYPWTTTTSTGLGIGTTNPQYKLDIDAQTGSTGNPLRLLGLNTGTTTDSILSSASGVIRRLSIADIVSAGGGNVWTNGSGTNAAMLPSSSNTASGERSVVSGFNNTASSQYASVIGGTGNNVSGSYSAIIGGQNLTLSGTSVLGFNGNSTAVNLSQGNMFYLGDADLWLGNTTNTARSLRFYEPNSSGTYSGTNYSAFRAQAQSADITYTLPSADGSSGQFLSTNGSGSLSWGTPTSNAWSLTGNSSTVDGTNFIGTTDNIPLNFRVNGQKAGRIDNALNSTFLGYESGLVNTGSNNTFIGNNVGRANSTGELNTFVGSASGESNTIGTENTAVGHQALRDNTTGNDNTAVGEEALMQNIDGISNTGLGESALENNTSGSENTAVGAEALFRNIDGDNNTAVGESALESNTSGSSNTATGREALFSNTSANRNIGIGHGAIFTQSYNNGGVAWDSDNIGIGYRSLYANQSTSTSNGYRNIAIGSQSLNANTTGASNLAIGYQAGNTLTTGSNNTLIGYDADVTSNSLTNATALGNGALVDASNKIRLGNTSVTLVETYGSFVTISDKRLKKNIIGNNIGLNFIKDLRPVHYELKDTAHKGIIYDGFIAQEIDTILKKYNTSFSGLSKPNTEGGYYTVNYATFVVPLVNAVKELDEKNTKISDENAKLKAELEKIKTENAALKISVDNNSKDIEAIKAMLEKKQN